MWKTVLLDIDGTLLDSNDGHARAWEDAFREHGFAITYDSIFPIVGLGGDKLLEQLTPGLNDKRGVGQQIARRRKEIFQGRYLARIRPTPGARDLVLRIKQDGMNAIVATSAEHDEVQALLRAAGVDDLIDQQANASDASGSKPDPDIVLAALDKSGSAAADCIMIGDTPYDLEAAARSGVAAIALRSGGHDADLAGALAVYDHPADLLEHWSESPLGAREPAVL